MDGGIKGLQGEEIGKARKLTFAEVLMQRAWGRAQDSVF